MREACRIRSCTQLSHSISPVTHYRHTFYDCVTHFEELFSEMVNVYPVWHTFSSLVASQSSWSPTAMQLENIHVQCRCVSLVCVTYTCASTLAAKSPILTTTYSIEGRGWGLSAKYHLQFATYSQPPTPHTHCFLCPSLVPLTKPLAQTIPVCPFPRILWCSLRHRPP